VVEPVETAAPEVEPVETRPRRSSLSRPAGISTSSMSGRPRWSSLSRPGTGGRACRDQGASRQDRCPGAARCPAGPGGRAPVVEPVETRPRWSSLSRPGPGGRACRDQAPVVEPVETRPRWSSLSRP